MGGGSRVSQVSWYQSLCLGVYGQVVNLLEDYKINMHMLSNVLTSDVDVLVFCIDGSS